MSGPVLEAHGLRKTYTTGRGLFARSATVKAVDGASLTLHRGEILGVVGESGCGKSTLARMLVGLELPDEGSVLVGGENLAQARGARRRRLRRRVQMVFQDPYTSLNPRLTVADLIGEPLDVHRLAKGEHRRKRIAQLLELVGLPEAGMSRYPHEFSGGQRQRIGIARALALEPEILVCDEAVSALDVSVQAQVVNLLRDLQRRLGLAVVFIAHDLAVVRYISDRVGVMYLGRFAEFGDNEKIFGDPRHPYTQALLSAIPEPDPLRARDDRRIRLSGEPPSPIDPPPGCLFHTRCWKMTEYCRTHVPLLGGPPEEPRVAACHYAWDELTPAGARAMHARATS